MLNASLYLPSSCWQLHSPRQHLQLRRGIPGARHSQRKSRSVQANSQKQATGLKAQPFPASYEQAVRQAQEAVKAAIADGCTLIEVEFPTTTLSSVMGDGEGQNEMNSSMEYMRKFLSAWRSEADSIRVFFPDNKELAVAISGQTADPGAGRKAFDPVFAAKGEFRLGYLTKQNAVWAALGVNLGLGEKFSPVQQIKDSDKMFVIAYPSFNPREELSAVYDIFQQVASQKGQPIIIFNGELDRVRGGYYPALFFPEVAKVGKELLPKATAAYYIHNFKGTRPGTLFRCYPGPWQVLRRNPLDENDVRILWEGDTMPTLKEVALEILPSR